MKNDNKSIIDNLNDLIPIPEIENSYSEPF
jgi:hypothetical protein